MQRTEYPMFVIADGAKPKMMFDLADGHKTRETVRSKLGSFTMEGTPPHLRRSQDKPGQQEKTVHAHHPHGHRHRKKHKRRDVDSIDRRKRESDEYLVI